MAVLAIAALGSWAGAAAITGTVLGMTGGAIGWLAGSMLGQALFTPTQKGYGPRLSDLTVGSSAYGTPIAYVQGHPRLAGQIVWASTKREIATTTKVGKGGPKQKVTTYTYVMDMMIMLTENQIDGVRKIWNNGKLIYSQDSGATFATLRNSVSNPLWGRMTVYTGVSSQLPDPTYEAAVGTNNAPAYRGRGCVFIQNLQLGQSGQIPNLTFEVVSTAVPTLVGFGQDAQGKLPPIPYTEPPYGVVSRISPGLFGNRAMGNNALGGFVFAQTTFVANGLGSIFNFGLGDWTIEGWQKYTYVNAGSIYIRGDDTPGVDNCYVLGIAASGVQIAGFASNVLLYAPNNLSTTYGQWHHFVAQVKSGVLSFMIHPLDGSLPQKSQLVMGNRPIEFTNLNLFDIGSGAFNGAIDSVRVSNVARYDYDNYVMPTAAFPLDENTVLQYDFDEYTALAATELTVQQVVTALLLRGGLTAGMFDVTGLASITTPVRALAVSQVSTVRAVLEILQSAYFFDVALNDKLRFVARGGASVASIPFEDLAAAPFGGQAREPLPVKRLNDLEVPAQVAMSFSNVDNDYQLSTELSDRLLTGQASLSAIQVPLAFTPAEAKKIVDTLLFDQSWKMNTTISVDSRYEALEPTDVVTVTAANGSTFRMRLLTRREEAGVLTFDAVIDDATVLSQTGLTSTANTSQTVVLASPVTVMALLDTPLVRTTDDHPGFTVMVKGAGDGWLSGMVYDSSDNVTYDAIQAIYGAAVFGTSSTLLANYTGVDFDYLSSVTVDVGAGVLTSSTEAGVLGSLTTNLAFLGTEAIQFVTATLVRTGVYTLTTLLRGCRGTEWARGTHLTAGEVFAMYGLNGAANLEISTGELYQTRYYKAVSEGQFISAVSPKTFTPNAVNLKPFSPASAFAWRQPSNDVLLTWVRRTRIPATMFSALAGAAIPLGETTEGYEVEIYTSNTYLTLKRTITSLSTPTLTYTSAQQVTDFGSNQATVYFKIYQLSSVVGRGYALTFAG
jgi:hypothetical protein